MKTKKYKILVLSDMKDSVEGLLNNSIEVAKILNADVDFFHVKKPTDIVSRESQLSAVRTINEQHITTGNKIKNLLEPISKNQGFKVNYKYAFGNVKEEIESQIKKIAPDLVVLGKRKSKTLRFIGDNITDFVMKTHKGAVMIASEKKELISANELSLGLLNSTDDSFNNDLTKQLIEKTQRPLRSFKIANKDSREVETLSDNNNKTVDYVFEDSSSAMKTISDYVNRNKINLLCVDRGTDNPKMANYAKNAVSKVNVSLLVT